MEYECCVVKCCYVAKSFIANYCVTLRCFWGKILLAKLALLLGKGLLAKYFAVFAKLAFVARYCLNEKNCSLIERKTRGGGKQEDPS